MALESRTSLPIRNPLVMVDYASSRGEATIQKPVEILKELPLIDCGLGDSPFGSPLALRELVNRSSTPELLIEAIEKYPPDKFCEGPTAPVRERFGLTDEPTIVFDGTGSYGLLSKIILELPDITPQNEIGVLGNGPQFPNIACLALKHGFLPDGSPKFPYESTHPDLNLTADEKIAHLIAERKKSNGKKIIYWDNPNNPTGDLASLQAIEALLDHSAVKGDLVIVDEAYGDAVDDKLSAIPLTEKYPNLIVLRGTAKVIGMAGIRIGYGAMSKPVGEIFQSLQLVFGVNGPTQVVASEVLKPQNLKPHLTGVRQKILEVKIELAQGLTNIGVGISPTNISVPILLAQGPDESFHRRLTRYQIVTEKGSDFRATYPLDDSWVRMRVPKTVEEAREVTRRIELAIKDQSI